MARIITDLHFDLLKYIMILVAKSSYGAENLAKAISVCTDFMKVAEETDVLKAVSFPNESISNRYWLFLQSNGLLYRCAQIGNVTAQYLLAKIILASSSQLLVASRERERIQFICKVRRTNYQAYFGSITRQNALASTFMAHFISGQACSTRASGQSLLHWELVRVFLCHCSALDLTEMHPYLDCYIDYFTERGSQANIKLHNFINNMYSSAYQVTVADDVDSVEIRGSVEANIATFNETEQPRLGNQSVLQKGKFFVLPEATRETVQSTVKNSYFCANFMATYYFLPRVGEFGGVCLDKVAIFEECRTEALVCLGEVFP